MIITIFRAVVELIVCSVYTFVKFSSETLFSSGYSTVGDSSRLDDPAAVVQCVVLVLCPTANGLSSFLTSRPTDTRA